MARQLRGALVGKPSRLEALMSYPELDVVAFCEIDDAVRAEGEARWGVRGYKDYREMLAKERLDFLNNSTPNHVHAEVAIAALQAGCHVYSEKPMATTMKECRAMVEAEAQSEGRLQIGLELRYSKMTARFKEIIASGEIGEVRNILFFHVPGGWLDETPRGRWKLLRETAGGLFLEKLVHEVDLFRWYAGEIEAVQVFAAPNVLPQYEFNDNAYAMVHFASGALGNISTFHCRAATDVLPHAFAQAGHQYEWSIVGTKGAMYADLWANKLLVMRFVPTSTGKGLKLSLDREENYEALPTGPLHHDVPGFQRDFIQRMLRGDQPLMSAADTLKTMAACFALEESSVSGRRVEVEG